MEVSCLKEKIILGILTIMFLITAGMFYYQNVYMKQNALKNQVPVFVAIKDIPEGAKFTSENIGMMRIDKKNVLPSYITDFSKIEGKIAKTSILKDEIITKGRVSSNEDNSKTFSVLVKPDEQAVLHKGDLVNVYVELIRTDEKNRNKLYYETYSIAKRKIVEDVRYKKSASGKVVEGVVDSIQLSLSEEQMLNYYLAKNMKEVKAKIVVVPFKNLLDKDNMNIPDLSQSPNYKQVKNEFGVDKNGKMIIEKSKGSTVKK